MDELTAARLARAVAEGGSGNAETVRELEVRLADLVGAAYGLCMSSGTAALVSALWACGVRPGDIVAVSALGPAMTGLAVAAVGARPVFLDAASPLSFGASTQSVAVALARQPRAAVLVPMWGYWDERTDTIGMLRAGGVSIIVDAAQAPFLRLRDPLCDLADVVCLSLHARKPLKAGEGGACLTNNERLAERVVSLRNFGQAAARDGRRVVPTGPFAARFGVNLKMNALGAAWCLAQLDAVREVRVRLDRLRDRAIEELRSTGVRWAEAARADDVVEHGRYGIAAICDSQGEAQRLAAALEARGVEVDTSRYRYQPMHAAPFLSRHEASCPTAHQLAASAVACRLEAFSPLLPDEGSC
jgi:dTDP-4-amino-4,6-dideoxygalactose transaminase